MWARVWLAMAVLVGSGCGRVGFQTPGSTDAAAIDATDAADAADPADATDGSTDTVIMYADFTDCGGLSLVGSATCEGGVLVLTPPDNGQEGGAWLLSPIALDPGVTITSELRLRFVPSPGDPPGDGFALLLQSDPRGPAALGGGSDLAYNSIAPSVAVELDLFGDTFDPVDGQHEAIHRDGDVEVWDDYYALDVDVVDMASGDPFTLWTTFADGSLTSSVTAGAPPTADDVTAAEDLARLGGHARLGMTAGTAFAAEGHEVLSWRVSISR